jgi:hypothetical protein
MSTTLKSVETTVFQQLGAASALFMRNSQPGTEQVMPTAALEEIGAQIMEAVKTYGIGQRTQEVLEADARLKDEFGEDWLEFRDVRLGELNGAAGK